MSDDQYPEATHTLYDPTGRVAHIPDGYVYADPIAGVVATPEGQREARSGSTDDNHSERDGSSPPWDRDWDL